MSLVYTIISGLIKSDEETTEVPFALVFLDNGIYRIETFFNDKDFFNQNYENNNFTLIGKTEKEYDIEIFGLECTRYKPANKKVEMICRDYIRLTNNKREKFENAELKKIKENYIWYIEIEGMKIKFGDNTFIEKYRDSGRVDEFMSHEYDHTRCSMRINIPEFDQNRYFLIFSKNPRNDNILIEFSSYEGYRRLYFNDYLLIKAELLSILSFANGGEVFVRRELTGGFYQYQVKDSQIVYLHSREKYSDFPCNDFIPINNNASYTQPIFRDLFFYCFDKYYNLNKELDLNALVTSINNSTLTSGVEERYYILITALEKISSTFSKLKSKGKQTLISKSIFDTQIKPKLLETLKEFEDSIDKESSSAFNILKSKLGGLNKSNDDIVQRLYEFFEYASIPINDAVRNLIEIERHLAVHEGIIGKTENERILNYWKLDHILRDCLLNIIGYKSYRKRKISYFKKSEMKHKETTKWQ